MPYPIHGLCWAAALILLATGNGAGLVDDASATTLFAIIPALAVIALGRSCRLPEAR